MTDIKIGGSERAVLLQLRGYARRDENCIYTRTIVELTGLKQTQARRAVRSLVRKGLAEYHRGVFDCDGMLAGSGYCISPSGETLADTFPQSDEAA